MAGRDLSSELFAPSGKDLSSDLFDAPAPEPEGSTGKDVLAGLVRGAGDIGATLLAPVDMARSAIDGKGFFNLDKNRERRHAMDMAMSGIGADINSDAYTGGKMASHIAGTLGVGGVLGNVASKLGAAPEIASSIASGGFKAGDVGLPARVASGAFSGASGAALVNPGDGKHIAIGAGLGGAIPAVAVAAGKAGQALAPKVSQEVSDLYAKAKSLGVDIPADRITNSKPLNALAASLEYMPLSGRAGVEEKMVSQLNRAVSKTFGQDSPNVTMALRKAAGDLGKKFDDVLTKNTVKIDQQFLDDLSSVESLVVKELDPLQGKVIKNQIDEILSKATNGEVDGKAAYNIKKTLDRIGNRNSNEAFYARELKKKLMDALNRSLPADEASAFATVRKQYGNMLDLENLASNGAEGGVSVGRLANLKNIGNQDLQDIADIAAQFVKSRESPHGALQRLVLGGLGAGLGASTGTLPMMGAGMVAGRAANSALNSDVMRRLVLNGNGGILGSNTGEYLSPVIQRGLLSRDSREVRQ